MTGRLLKCKLQDQFKSLCCHLLAFRIMEDSFLSLKAAYSGLTKDLFSLFKNFSLSHFSWPK